MSLLLAAAMLAMDPGMSQAHDHGPQLGRVSFKTTCNPAGDALVQRGLAWLHSFEYQRAEASFSEAAAVDPRCAIASWGAAMCQ